MPKAPIPMGALNFNPPLPETKASSKEVDLHPRFCVSLAVFYVLCDVMVHGAAFHLAFFRSPVYRTFNMLSFAHWEKFPVITSLNQVLFRYALSGLIGIRNQKNKLAVRNSIHLFQSL